jgi:hypothetical protein
MGDGGVVAAVMTVSLECFHGSGRTSAALNVLKYG